MQINILIDDVCDTGVALCDDNRRFYILEVRLFNAAIAQKADKCSILD